MKRIRINQRSKPGIMGIMLLLFMLLNLCVGVRSSYASVSSNPTSYQTTIGTPVTIKGVVDDANGNPIASTNISVTSDTPDVPSQSINTNSQGSFFLTYTPKEVGTDHVTFTIGGTSTTATVTVQQGNPQSISLQSSTGSSFSSAPLTITAGQTVNLQGNVDGPYSSPFSGASVVVASPTDGTDNFMPNGSLTTNSAGSFSDSGIIMTLAGTQFIQATTGGVSSPAQVQVTVQPSSPNQIINLQANPVQIGAGSTTTLAGTLKDQYGNPVPNANLTIVGSDTNTTVTTQADGVFTSAQKITTAGMTTLKVQYNGSTLQGGTVSVNVLPTGAYNLSVNLSATQVTAGNSLIATITLKDNTGATVSGKTLTLSESPTSTALTQTSVTTDNNGQAVVTVGPLTKVGYESLTATMDGVANVIGTATFKVLPGAPNQLYSSVSPSTAQVNTNVMVFGTVTDSYANPISGATVTVSGGYGGNVSGTTGSNGYFSISIVPTNIGGPFSLHYVVTSSFGNFSVNQNTLTVIAPISVPVDKVLAGTVIAGQTGTMPNKVGSGTVITPGPTDQAIPQGYYDGAMSSGKVAGVSVPTIKVLEGTVIAGQTGTMPNMAVRNPNGMGSGRSAALQYWTGGGSTVFLKPQQGYYDGNDTWTYYNDPNLVPGNIKSGVPILGVTGTAPTMTLVAGDSVAVEDYNYQTYSGTENVWADWIQYRNMGFKINVSGTYRIKFQLTGPSGSGDSAYAQVRVNGATVGTTFAYYHYQFGGGAQSEQEDLTLNAGDYVTIWFRPETNNWYSPYASIAYPTLCYGVANSSSFATFQ